MGMTSSDSINFHVSGSSSSSSSSQSLSLSPSESSSPSSLLNDLTTRTVAKAPYTSQEYHCTPIVWQIHSFNLHMIGILPFQECQLLRKFVFIGIGIGIGIKLNNSRSLSIDIRSHYEQYIRFLAYGSSFFLVALHDFVVLVRVPSSLLYHCWLLSFLVGLLRLGSDHCC
mmetsp:Transcript_31303/g.35038  ORF Transcript_31303/g.35038 Transcript_31303/m.35038 type:complete len:170 (-) Transcript_31303:47-556(-)